VLKKNRIACSRQPGCLFRDPRLSAPASRRDRLLVDHQILDTKIHSSCASQIVKQKCSTKRMEIRLNVLISISALSWIKAGSPCRQAAANSLTTWDRASYDELVGGNRHLGDSGEIPRGNVSDRSGPKHSTFTIGTTRSGHCSSTFDLSSCFPGGGSIRHRNSPHGTPLPVGRSVYFSWLKQLRVSSAGGKIRDPSIGGASPCSPALSSEALRDFGSPRLYTKTSERSRP